MDQTDLIAILETTGNDNADRHLEVNDYLFDVWNWLHNCPLGPESIKVVELFVFEMFQLFFGWWHHLVKKIVFFKLKPDVNFIMLNDKKVTSSLCIATIA